MTPCRLLGFIAVSLTGYFALAAQRPQPVQPALQQYRNHYLYDPIKANNISPALPVTLPGPDQFAMDLPAVISEGVPGPGAGNIEAPGAKDVYSFTATPGQQVYFDEISGTCASTIFWQCVDETGTVIFNEQLGRTCKNIGERTLALGSTYTITVSGANSSTGTYQFGVYPVVIDQFAIDVPSVISEGVPGPGAGNIEAAGAKDVYTFTATPGQKVYFDEISDTCASTIFWQCVDESGTVIFNEQLGRTCKNIGERTLALGGTYTITVSGANSSTGTYQFGVYPVVIDQFAIDLPTAISDGVPGPGAGNIEASGAMDVYTFTATPGQRVEFNEISGTCASTIFWQCVDESGTVIFNEQLGRTCKDVGERTLALGGTYTITVSGANSSTGTYQFQLINNMLSLLLSATISDTGQPIVTLHGPTNANYTLESAISLNPPVPWMPHAYTLIMRSNAVQMLEPVNATNSQLFFRALREP